MQKTGFSHSTQLPAASPCGHHGGRSYVEAPAEMAGRFRAGFKQLLGCQVIAELRISQTLAWRSYGGREDEEDEVELRRVVRLRTR
jgi:hypothetical protein